MVSWLQCVARAPWYMRITQERHVCDYMFLHKKWSSLHALSSLSFCRWGSVTPCIKYSISKQNTHLLGCSQYRIVLQYYIHESLGLKYEWERDLFLSWYMCLKWLNDRAPVRKTGDLRFKFQLRHNSFSQYLSYIWTVIMIIIIEGKIIVSKLGFEPQISSFTHWRLFL